MNTDNEEKPLVPVLRLEYINMLRKCYSRGKSIQNAHLVVLHDGVEKTVYVGHILHEKVNKYDSKSERRWQITEDKKPTKVHLRFIGLHNSPRIVQEDMDAWIWQINSVIEQEDLVRRPRKKFSKKPFELPLVG